MWFFLLSFLSWVNRVKSELCWFSRFLLSHVVYRILSLYRLRQPWGEYESVDMYWYWLILWTKKPAPSHLQPIQSINLAIYEGPFGKVFLFPSKEKERGLLPLCSSPYQTVQNKTSRNACHTFSWVTQPLRQFTHLVLGIIVEMKFSFLGFLIKV